MAVSKLPSIPEYVIWQAMKRRCDSPKVKAYYRYGGRNIRVCERWLHDFWAFYSDMGPRPSKEYTLERRDNDGDYEPSNCFWATRKEQARNRSSNHLVEYQGKLVTLSELSEITGIGTGTLWFRANLGLKGEALTKPVGRQIEFRDVRMTLPQWASHLNINYDVLLKRLNTGWTVEDAFTTPVLKPKEYFKSGKGVKRFQKPPISNHEEEN